MPGASPSPRSSKITGPGACPSTPSGYSNGLLAPVFALAAQAGACQAVRNSIIPQSSNRLLTTDGALRAFALCLALFGPFSSPVAGQTATESPLVDRLASLLEGRSGASYWATVHRLEELGVDAVDALRDKLAAPNERVRLGCAKALLQIGATAAERDALETLEQLARRASDREVRIDAVRIYGEEGDPDEALEVLTAVFDDTIDPTVVIPVARALWDIDRVSAARDKLVSYLESKDLEVRSEAALALAEIGYYEGPVRGLLRSLAKEPTPRGQRAVLLDRIVRLSRQLESKLDESGAVGGDLEKLVEIKEQRIQELENELAAGAPTRPAPARTEVDAVLDEVIEHIQREYVDPKRVARDDLLLAAVEGMVSSLDPHSVFMDVELTTRFDQGLNGHYPGIGARVAKLPSGPLEIVQPIYGGAAHREGLRSGDRILEIDGKSTLDIQVDDLTSLLKGPVDSMVELLVLRRGWTEPKRVTFRRETIEVPSVYWERLPEGLAYIRLVQFGERSAREFREALDDLQAEAPIEGLLVDVRGNVGGYLNVAVRIVDLFVDASSGLPIVSQRGRDGKVDSPPHMPTPEAEPDYPIVVLVNEGSASAAEILAGSLQDFGRARVVGTRTFGKGSVQRQLPLTTRPGAQLKLTTQYYFLPLGRCVHTERDEHGEATVLGGVEPDVIVDLETLPEWRYEERTTVRRREEIQAYVDAHFERLVSIVPIGDRGDRGIYEGFDALFESLDTRLPPEDVRTVIRLETQRRLEDERGREFALNLPEDSQLQGAVLELLRLMQRTPAADGSAYTWIPAPREGGED